MIFVFVFFLTDCRFMNRNAFSSAKNIGSIVGASISPSPTLSLLDSTMPPINNENVECVGNGPTTNVGT
jgi:hypothetical protein